MLTNTRDGKESTELEEKTERALTEQMGVFLQEGNQHLNGEPQYLATDGKPRNGLGARGHGRGAVYHLKEFAEDQLFFTVHAFSPIMLQCETLDARLPSSIEINTDSPERTTR